MFGWRLFAQERWLWQELKKLSKDIEKMSKKMGKAGTSIMNLVAKFERHYEHRPPQAMKKKYHELRTSQKDKAQDFMHSVQKEAHYATRLTGHAWWLRGL